VIPGTVLNRIDCSRLKLPPEELGRLDSAVAVVVGLALPGIKGVKQLDLLPPEVVLGRKRKRVERVVILVGVVLLVAMIGLGALRFLKVHDTENKVAALQTQISSLKVQIPEYSKIQQQRSLILGLAAISNPIVNDEVYWPGVLSALAVSTPTGGTITSFSGILLPRTTATTNGAPAAPAAPAATQIASLNISLQSPTGYTYFHSWYFAINGSKKLTVNGFSGITQAAAKQVTFSATVGVTAEIPSIRANEFKVPS
jgi:Tfp pilus assembly protein PilN